MKRRLPVGAEVHPGYGVHFRVWAPRREHVEVLLEDGALHPLQAEAQGYFSGFVPGLGTGARYRYRLDGGDAFPDPASRFQPEGPHGPSQVVDPATFAWSDEGWRGIGPEGQVIYEMHIGTFTREGTWSAAMDELGALRDLGVTVLEMMPLADFAGRFGWGYDGVNLYAPTRLYGEPDDFRRFVDAAHAAGLGVILDVVYNHLGPDGNYVGQYSADYFSRHYENEWGEPLNFDGDNHEPVREFFVANAGYWIDEFHLDGLRLDATQQIFDRSDVNVMREVRQRVRDAARGRGTLVVAENEPQDTRLVRSVDAGGYGIDALWNDDFHHACRVAATGHREAYYTDYLGSAQELVSAVKHGFLFQGQRYHWQRQRRGTCALGIAPSAFVHYLQNHDQVANSSVGRRLHELTSPGRYRALTALLLLAPQTPLLFQGQEFAASSPFHFFADHNPELAQAVRRGRAEFLGQFRSMATPELRERLPVPDDRRTFEACKLDFTERETHASIYTLHCDLLRLRREDEVFGAQPRGALDGAVLAPEAFVIRFFAPGQRDRLLVVNLGRDLHLVPAPEPLLAPFDDCRWDVLWSSEHPDYGGGGTPSLEAYEGWRIPGHAAVVLIPKERKRHGESQC